MVWGVLEVDGVPGSPRLFEGVLEVDGVRVGSDQCSALIWKAGGVVVLSPRSFGGSVGLNEASTLF